MMSQFVLNKFDLDLSSSSCNPDVWLELSQKIHSLFRGELHPPKVLKNTIIDN